MNEYPIDISGKGALKVGKLPSLKVIRPKRTKLLLHKVREILQMFVRGRGHEIPPTVKRSVKVRKIAKLMCSLVFVKSVSNLAALLILSCFFG